MGCLNLCKQGDATVIMEEGTMGVIEDYTIDGSTDWHGNPAGRATTGTWVSGNLILVNQGLATLAFFGVAVNLVLFLTRVMGQDNADAANNVSKWTGTVYMCSLVGAFLSDSYWGRYRTCVVFQAILVLGLGLLSLTSYKFLLRPRGCGDEKLTCGSHSSLHEALFYLSVYLVALGYGGYQPNVATFGADQFDEGDPKEGHSKIAFFSYFYLALNLGSLFSNTILGYYENEALWTLGFWAAAGSSIIGLILFICGTTRYRYFKPGGNPFPRFCQVFVAAMRKWKVNVGSNQDKFFEVEEYSKGGRRILHTEGFRFLDKAAFKTSEDLRKVEENGFNNPWHLCTVTQVEEVKCLPRLIPIWLCTIIYSVVFTQMASTFVEQGAAMETRISSSSSFKIPPASMSCFDILSVAAFIFIYRRVLNPLVAQKNNNKGLTELQRMGIGLIIAMMAMVSAGVVEHFRLKNAMNETSSSLSIFWQTPQYVLIGASEVFMYVGQLEFFNGQTPEGLKSFGSALCMTSMSLGNYVSSLIVAIVMKISKRGESHGWIPSNLNKGHLDKFYYLLAALVAIDFAVYISCAKWYRPVKFEERNEEEDDNSKMIRPVTRV